MGAGPLHGVKVLEIASAAPGPFGVMMLCDLGAEVLRIDRAVPGDDGLVNGAAMHHSDVLGRGRRAVALDLKAPESIALVLDLVTRVDVIVEGFRPGVMERLGLGPDVCMTRNPGLVYGRITGWGQEGPLARAAGHDIDYIGLTGALHLVGTPEKPIAPVNMVGDFAGGGMLLAFGILAAIVERNRSGLGQVVDAAMVDGAGLLTTFLHGMHHAGTWQDRRGVNRLDGGVPYYDTYETADARHVAIGPVENKFYAELLERLSVDADPADQNEPSTWPATRATLEQVFRTKTRDEWCALLEGTDTCFAPVLSLLEAPEHPHNQARRSFVEVGGYVQPAPAPRFSRTPAGVPTPPPPKGRGEGTRPLLDWDVPADLVDAAVAAGVVVTSD